MKKHYSIFSRVFTYFVSHAYSFHAEC